MRFYARHAVECAAVFEAYGRGVGAGKIDDFLQTVPSGTTRDEDTFERTLRAQGVPSNESSSPAAPGATVCRKSSILPAPPERL
jgi:hypothetical protein